MYNPYQMYQQQNIPRIVSVRNEQEAKDYPIAPNNSIIFKDENAPYIYIKTMGLSQFDAPTFDKFKLVREDAVLPQETISKPSVDNSTIEKIQSDITAILDEIDGIKKKLNTRATIKKKELDDEQ